VLEKALQLRTHDTDKGHPAKIFLEPNPERRKSFICGSVGGDEEVGIGREGTKKQSGFL